MTSQNEEAEELMRKIEKEEDQLAFEEPEQKYFHLCIVNLVIGYKMRLPIILLLAKMFYFFLGHCTAQKETTNLEYLES